MMNINITVFATDKAPVPTLRTRNNVYTIDNDKREYVRVEAKALQNTIKLNANGTTVKVIDISRGGIKFAQDSNFNIGEIIPVQIQYKDININTKLEVVRKNTKDIGTKFVQPENIKVANELMYLSIKLEADSGNLITRFSECGVL